MAELLISLFSVAHSVDEDSVLFQGEKDAMVADAQAVFADASFELLHVSGEVVLQLVEPKPMFRRNSFGKPRSAARASSPNSIR